MVTRRCAFALRVVLLLAVGVLVGCAATPLPPARALDRTDLPRLAGTWEWASRWETPAVLGGGPVRVRLDSGRLAFETARATGIMTLHEGEGWRVLAGEGQERTGGRTFSFRLAQRAPGSAPGAATGPLVVLVVSD